MLRTLLSPLSARFSAPPFPHTPSKDDEDDELDPGDFARDVLIELMRNSVQRLKEAQHSQSKLEVMVEIYRIMQENSCTKDVFRELDGFLSLINALSTMTVEEPSVTGTLEQIRLVFMITSEAMKKHLNNSDYFTQRIGYESLSRALPLLISDSRTKHHTLGCVLSLALQDFSLSGYFQSSHGLPDACSPEFGSKTHNIHEPGAIRVLWNFMPELDPASQHAILKLVERLASQHHRNRAVISNLEITASLFQMFLDCKKDPPKRSIIQKLLKRTLDLGASTSNVKAILQHVVTEDGTLNPDVLEILRNASKGRWPRHLSMESPAALSLRIDGVRGAPPTGFTFMAWVWIERLPQESSQVIFGLRINSNWIVCLSLTAGGKLAFKSAGNRNTVLFPSTNIFKSRWTHIALTHYTHRAMHPTIRVFIDGIFTDSINWGYPIADSSAKTATYVIGDNSAGAMMQWCLASSYFLSLPLDDNLFRFIHHLGPRYASNFQSDELFKLLTYEASTSLNIFLFNAKVASQTPSQELMNAIKSGLRVDADSFVFALTPDSPQDIDPASNAPSSTVSTILPDDQRKTWTREGDILTIDAHCFDMAMWKLGGAAVALRLVQLANDPHGMSRALGILTDGLRNSWQNSEDMERIRGYDVLSNLLRSKSHLINMTGFETLFEFIGLNFRIPDNSTIVNTVAYRTIALDFVLWSRTNKEIQRAHFDHFVILVETSRYKRFNVRQRFSKMGMVRKFLFVLRTDLYQPDALPSYLEAFKSIVRAQFFPDETIKPLLSMLAANLHEENTQAGSPRSVISRTDHVHSRAKAEHVLEILVSILSSVPQHLQRFAAVLPLTRICLLLLGERPSPAIATQILLLIGISIHASRTFIRKFELIGGWTALTASLPYGWDMNVHVIAFDVLLGRIDRSQTTEETPEVVCPNIAPAIFASLHRGLGFVATDSQFCADSELEIGGSYSTTEADLEALLEELIRLHPTSPTFRQIFKSSKTTQIFIDAFKYFTDGLRLLPEIKQTTVNLTDKMSHFALALALDSNVSTAQQQELFDAVGIAQAVLNPNVQTAPIDPGLVPSSLFGRRRITAGRMSVQLGERTVQTTISRIHDWRKTIIISENKRLRRTLLDLRENQRQITRITDWMKLVTNEHGIWPHSVDNRLSRLDETEGPHRVRIKLEPGMDPCIYSKVDDVTASGAVGVDSSASSIIQVEIPPWEESYELSSTEPQDQLTDEIAEDKHRRVRHELEPGDVIEAVITVARIVGVDSSPGLLIFGRINLYFLDGLVESDEGEVIDAHDAPRKLLFIPGSVLDLDGHQGAQRWTYDQVIDYTNRAFLFRDIGIEIYFKDRRSLLLVFLEMKHRQSVHQRLSSVLTTRVAADPNNVGLLKTPLFGRVSAMLLSGLRPDELLTAQRKWQAREISNFTYLSILNQLSGRTPSDATQYPVFPWVLQDYSSEVLNLKSRASFRDLTKPMGALTQARRNAAESRYTSLQSVDEKPFHYGTHFSSSMIVCHFLIRLAPFTNMFKTLQGGDWDLPDRLFTDVRRAYESASQDIRGDVRELIPEFYTCPEFLENLANLDFGTQLNSREKIHDVKLPPWAKQDPLVFVTLNRRALESDQVSKSLHQWIDLIWGYKQRDPESLNVFHPLSYEGSIDLDKITDDLEREATVGIIHNFGQTPRKIFNTPHPPRIMQGVTTLPLGSFYGVEENFQMLEQSQKVIQDLNICVRNIVVTSNGDGIVAHPDGVLSVPSYPHEQVDWSSGRSLSIKTGELRVIIDRTVVQVVEAAFCNCAAFADSDCLVTGSGDHTVRLWKLTRTVQEPLRVTLSHIMRAHQEPVMCVAASRAWSIVVSGSTDGRAVIWDLNRGVYVTSIWHGKGENNQVHLATINESTGYIATCSSEKLCLHTVNARHIATLGLLSSSISPPIMSLAFLEREYSFLGVLATGGSDGTIVLRTWNADYTPSGEPAKWEFRTLRELRTRKMGEERGRNVSITELKFVRESLYHGQDDGKVYCWNFAEY